MTADTATTMAASDAAIISISAGTRRFHDAQVGRVAGWVDGSPLLERVEAWKREARKGAGGRRETFPVRALLVAMILAAISNQPLLVSTITEIMFLQMSPAMRSELGIPEPTTPYSAGS